MFDLHKEIDGLREAELAGTGKAIGTTKRGIGPGESLEGVLSAHSRWARG